MGQFTTDLQSSMKKIMLAVLCIGSAGMTVCGALYRISGASWLLSMAITCGMFVYHILIRFLSPVILHLLCRRHYDPHSRWFRQKAWEPALYAFLKVKRWKKHMMSYDPKQFSAAYFSTEEIINNMCHAEAVHTCIIPMSLASVCFAIPFGALSVFLTTAIAASLFDLLFIIMQRYNRPRLMRLLQTSLSHSRSEHKNC